MPISVVCPFCAAKLNAPEKMAGRQILCPKCGREISVPIPITAEPLPPSDDEAGADSSWLRLDNTLRSETSQVFDQPPGNAVQARWPFDEGAREYRSQEPERRPERAIGIGPGPGLGVASLALGCITFAFSLVPCIGLYAIPISLAGIALGVVGSLLSEARSGRGIGIPGAGVGLNLLAILVSIAWVIIPFFILARTTQEITEKQKAEELARERTERAARERADRVAREQSAREAREATKEAKERTDQEAKEAARVKDEREREERQKEERAQAEKERKAKKVAEDARLAPIRAENRAAAKLKLIKMLIQDGLKDKAELRLEQLIKDYPKTKAADEARDILKHLND